MIIKYKYYFYYINANDKDILNSCNAAVFYDYTNIGITCELNQVRKCMSNSFYKAIPHSRILVSLSIIDDVILKLTKMISKILLKIFMI